MSYNVNIDGCEGQNIELRVSFFSGPKLFVNGEPAPKGNKRGEMVLRRNDGREIVARWKPQFMGLDVPQLVVDGETLAVVEPLKWYEWLWGGLPILLVFVGGLLGALAGVIGFFINTKVFRSNLNGFLKYVVSGVVSVLALVAYLAAAAVFLLLIAR